MTTVGALCSIALAQPGAGSGSATTKQPGKEAGAVAKAPAVKAPPPPKNVVLEFEPDSGKIWWQTGGPTSFADLFNAGYTVVAIEPKHLTHDRCVVSLTKSGKKGGLIVFNPDNGAITAFNSDPKTKGIADWTNNGWKATAFGQTWAGDKMVAGLEKVGGIRHGCGSFASRLTGAIPIT